MRCHIFSQVPNNDVNVSEHLGNYFTVHGKIDNYNTPTEIGPGNVTKNTENSSVTIGNVTGNGLMNKRIY